MLSDRIQLRPALNFALNEILTSPLLELVHYYLINYLLSLLWAALVIVLTTLRDILFALCPRPTTRVALPTHVFYPVSSFISCILAIAARNAVSHDTFHHPLDASSSTPPTVHASTRP
ncbi:hypothetical protein BOTBODRAFT_557952 [Botryobasidium botryosum FD-172 SS1]|uniref:Uncharacterized protein n=1 Tax=Botryobasidium botryosum (strain FD-172 SS1) TaxID=930990 RepID=A0A067M225_BOTB1|nr:hypothetical protein BOTBODRAFT_557952 [Botryobasidium botryosum FD-172 SS1]